MNDLKKWYQVLELEPGVSIDEINQAYKDLVFIWHPDRIPKDNVRLQQKAQDKLKQLNQARDYLRAAKRDGRSRFSSFRRSSHSRSSYRQSTPRSSENSNTTSQAYRDRRSPSYSPSYRAQRAATNTDEPKRYRYQPPKRPGFHYPDSSTSTSQSASTQSPRESQSSQSYRASNGSSNHHSTSTPPSSTVASNGSSFEATSKATSGHPSSPSTESSPSVPDSRKHGDSRSPAHSASDASTPSVGFRASSRYQSAYYSRSSPTNQPVYPQTPISNANSQPDLDSVDWSGRNLSEKDFSGRNLSSANLSYADLSDAFLHRVNFNRANLNHANLFRANLLQANLSHANLRNANLVGADLSGADLSGADLSGARVGVPGKIMVKLTGTNLRGAIMPDGTIHE